MKTDQEEAVDWEGLYLSLSTTSQNQATELSRVRSRVDALAAENQMLTVRDGALDVTMQHVVNDFNERVKQSNDEVKRLSAILERHGIPVGG